LADGTLVQANKANLSEVTWSKGKSSWVKQGNFLVSFWRGYSRRPTKADLADDDFADPAVLEDRGEALPVIALQHDGVGLNRPSASQRALELFEPGE